VAILSAMATISAKTNEKYKVTKILKHKGNSIAQHQDKNISRKQVFPLLK
jgi:hypothetical protein